MTIRAKVWQGVRRGDEGRRPRVAVALGLLVRPRRTRQSGRGGARGRHVTLFQRRCWFGMSACLSWPVSAARGGSDGIGMLPRAPAAAPLSRRTCAPRPTCASPFPLVSPLGCVRPASSVSSSEGPQRRCRRCRSRDFVNLAESTFVGGCKLSSGQLSFFVSSPAAI
jgi:hypothetical protein